MYNCPKINIILIKYNQPEFEARCIESIGRFTEYPNFDLTAYQNKRGVGLAKIWNKLIEQSDAEYICLLNNDTVVTENWLTNLLETFKLKDDCGGVCPSSNIVGEQMKVSIPYERMEDDINVINEFGKRNWEENKDEILERPGLSGFCMMFKREMWESLKWTGKNGHGFDERFFFYGEDSEFAWRIKNYADKKCYWRKGVFVHHYGRQSTEKADNDGEINRTKLIEEAQKIFHELTNPTNQEIQECRSYRASTIGD